MQSLLDPQGSYIKSENNVKKYLKSISDADIKGFYENVELTPFPILLAKEYHKRFSKKKLSSKSSKKKPKKWKSFSDVKTIKTTSVKKMKKTPFRHGTGVKISKLRKR